MAQRKKSAFEDIAEKAAAKPEASHDDEEDELAAKATQSLNLNKSNGSTPNTSPNNAEVLGRKATTTTTSSNKKAAKKAAISSEFFADFDDENENDSADEEEEKKEEQGRYSKFNYSEEDERKKEDRTYSKSEPSITPAERAKKASVGSDSFVPTRGKMQMNTDKKDNNGTGYAQQNFSKAKSISSTQMFGEGENKVDENERKQRLSKFEGARAISSASYYDRDEESMSTGGGADASDIARRLAFTAKNDLSQMKDVVKDGSKKLASLASDWFYEWSK